MSKPRSLHHSATDLRPSRAKQMLLTLLVGFFAIIGAIASSGVNAAPNDFDKDAKSDLVLRNSTGLVELWLMNGAAAASKTTLLNAPGWTVTHMADFNGDGKVDILFRHTDGRVAMWLMNGATFIGGAGLLEAGSGWSVTQVADFNGDGKADILFRHTDGRVAMWLMNGTTLTSGAGLLEAASGWTVTHTGDFNGDGKADIVFRHTDGRVAMWLMNGLALTSGGGLLEAASGWSVTHTGDFNGDGKTDLLFSHTDGRVAMWLMNGTVLTSGAGLLGAASGWSTTHVADFNGDGKADLLFRHTDGRVAMWLMNGITLTSGAGLLNAASGWNVTHTGDFNGDGKADLVFLNTDGRIAIWIMNGITFVSGGGLTDAGTGWQVAPSSGAVSPITISPTANASRLLAQATFGATREEIDRVAALGAAAYLEEQFASPQTLHLDTVRNNPDYPTQPYAVMAPSIWKQYFEANDQLRQRMAFALSQILVISQQNNTIGDAACGSASYLDILGRNAFGNFRTLLKDVTLNAAMGHYLDMKQSAKADPVLNSIPNENYARELMQLFSIGTVMLNIDGSPQFVNGKTVETYSEATAQEVARAITGWTYAGQDQAKSWRWLYPDVPYPQNVADGITACNAWSKPMEPWTAAYNSADDKRVIQGGAHDTGAKTLLTYPGSDNFKKNVPANQTPMQDIDAVIDNIFNHPNVGPFISELLIQRLVTSNPGGAYVSRVASAFNNNGAGVRGDMKAVIRAILLDVEARTPPTSLPQSFGKLREPVIRFTQFHRAFNAKMPNGKYSNLYDFSGSDSLGQNPLRAPSVFNFYSPEFAPTGPISQNGLVGPEFGITNSATISGFMDFSKYAIINGFGQYETDKTKWIQPNYDYYIALAPNPTAMVDQLNSLLLSGSMSAQFRTQLIDVATKLTDSNITTQNAERFKTVLWLILNSPEYSIQK